MEFEFEVYISLFVFLPLFVHASNEYELNGTWIHFLKFGSDGAIKTICSFEVNSVVKCVVEALFNKLILVSLIVLLSACGATQPPKYQKDRKPEDRDQYSGAEGLTQQQKDQTYLMNKELSDKCKTAKIDLAIAETDKNASEIQNQRALINSTCI